MRKIVLSFIGVLFLWGILAPQDIHSKNYAPDEQLLLVGAGAFRDGFYDIAEKQFSEFIQNHPNHEKRYEVCYLLGRTLFLKKKLRESKTLFLKILNENKKFEHTDHALYWLAEIEIRLGNPEEARKLLSSLVKRFPKFERIDYAYYLLGVLDFEYHRLSEAEASLKKVPLSSHQQEIIQASLFWLGLLSFRQKDYEGAIGYFKTLWEDPKLPTQGFLKYALFWLGEAHLRSGRFMAATAHFRTFQERFSNDPFLPEVQWRLGFCQYRSGNFGEAINIFQGVKRQLKESPLLVHTHYLLGRMFLFNSEPSASIREINSIIDKFPGHPLTGISFLILFWNYIHLGESNGANKVFQRLQKLNHMEDEKHFIHWLTAELLFSEGKVSDSLPYYFNIVNSRFREKALYQMGRGYFFENKLREAMTNLDILLLEFPNSQYAEEGLFVKAECLNRLGNVDQALETYELVVRQGQKDLWRVLALTQIGNLHLARNEIPQAQTAFKRVINQFADHPLYYHAACQLGNLNFKMKNIGEALHYFTLVLKGNILEYLGEAYFGLGEIFYQQGKYDKALTHFETAIRYVGETSLWFFLTQLEIGNLHRNWGKYDKAKKAYTVILNHSKDEEMRQAAKALLNQLGSR
ncbi:MAG: tetratricopeptide repeat protein [Thermodesulfobacteriota bacterium]